MTKRPLLQKEKEMNSDPSVKPRRMQLIDISDGCGKEKKRYRIFWSKASKNKITHYLGCEVMIGCRDFLSRTTVGQGIHGWHTIASVSPQYIDRLRPARDPCQQIKLTPSLLSLFDF